MPPSSARGSVLALHGFTGHPAAFEAVWASWPDAGRGFGTHCPYLTGHGLEPDLSGTCFADEVDRVRRLAAALPAPRHLVGYSMGGRLALGLLNAAPELFTSALLLGTHPGLTVADERSARQIQEDEWRRLLETEGLASFTAHFEALPVFASQVRLPAQRIEDQRRARLAHTAAGLSHALRVLGLADMPCALPALGRVALPVTLLVGELDQKFQELARTMADHLPRAELRVVPAAGHNLLIEAPEVVAHELARLTSDKYSLLTNIHK